MTLLTSHINCISIFLDSSWQSRGQQPSYVDHLASAVFPLHLNPFLYHQTEVKSFLALRALMLRICLLTPNFYLPVPHSEVVSLLPSGASLLSDQVF